ncbi:MAG: CAP domain-containing protein [Spirochaetae bacterium HGW-Spirochaetae-7]|nr:MAG: CAP domain-containing protein [Spirochaetae bacterium HGW-Spirochaetae-7]
MPVPSALAAVPSSGTATRPTVALNAGVTDSSFAQAIEIETVAELNMARTQPGTYAGLLREYRKSIRGMYFERPGEVTVVLNEGAKAVDEAIAFLERQKPVSALSLSRGLSLAAMDHAKDRGRTGQTGHGGSDRSTMDTRIKRYGTWKKTAGENIAYGAVTARDIVIQLIVDDGVPSRGHRNNIFNPEFLVVGIAFGSHPGYRTVCVQDFAGEYEER